MEYRYATTKRNEEDFASGRLLYGGHGTTAFPVRLASELVQRGLAHLERLGKKAPYRLYDPFCGGGYLATLLGFLQPGVFARIEGSDLNEGVLSVAERNLSLLTPAGLEERTHQLQELERLYGKPSHREALESAKRLAALTEEQHASLECRAFCHDSTGLVPPAEVREVDLVFTDLPYGELVSWQGEARDPIPAFLEQLGACLAAEAIVVVVANKGQKLVHPAYERKEAGKIGKRQFAILEWKGRPQ
ncbi:hypothetical protein [Gorillibacterium sp. CAU 1737]|uniref:hypothetical protein n=1 Tax=Gorillibacterium sp. CAU 1737 TaxID=3140362 RepID=UPI003260C744